MSLLKNSPLLATLTLTGFIYAAPADKFEAIPTTSVEASFANNDQTFSCPNIMSFSAFDGGNAFGTYESDTCASGHFSGLQLVRDIELLEGKFVNGKVQYDEELYNELLTVEGDSPERFLSDIESISDREFDRSCDFFVRGFWSMEEGKQDGRVAFCFFEVEGTLKFEGYYWFPALSSDSLFEDFEFDGTWDGQF